jgi:hypothetical protein
MTTLFNFRSNTAIKARVSNKIWRITRNGRFVKRKWGRALMKRGRPKFAGLGHELITHFETVGRARRFVKRIVARKINEGYDRLRRRRS